MIVDQLIDKISDESDLFNDDIYCHTCAEFDCDFMEPVLKCSECNQMKCYCECTICEKVDCICTCDDCHQVKCVCYNLSESGNYYCLSCKKLECNCSTTCLVCPACNHITHTCNCDENTSIFLPQTLQAIGTTSSGRSNQDADDEVVMAGIVVQGKVAGINENVFIDPGSNVNLVSLDWVCK